MIMSQLCMELGKSQSRQGEGTCKCKCPEGKKDESVFQELRAGAREGREA